MIPETSLLSFTPYEPDDLDDAPSCPELIEAYIKSDEPVSITLPGGFFILETSEYKAHAPSLADYLTSLCARRLDDDMFETSYNLIIGSSEELRRFIQTGKGKGLRETGILKERLTVKRLPPITLPPTSRNNLIKTLYDSFGRAFNQASKDLDNLYTLDLDVFSNRTDDPVKQYEAVKVVLSLYDYNLNLTRPRVQERTEVYHRGRGRGRAGQSRGRG
jgi:hypothetical protein